MGEQNNNSNIVVGNGYFLIWLGGFCLLLIVSTGVGIWALSGTGSELPWMIMALGGFSILVVFLYSGSVIFRIFGMHDPTQALGLPRHSVRSLLTFLIFTILMAFIFYSTHLLTRENFTQRTIDVTKDTYQSQVDALTKKEIIFSAVEYQAKIRDEEGNIAKKEDGVTDLDPVSMYKITMTVEINPAIREYLERILIALLSITSSIIGFYFGSRTGGDGKANAGNQQADPTPGAPPTPVPTPVPAPVGDAADGADWTLSSPQIILTPKEDGSFAGQISFTGEDISSTQVFEASFVPTELTDDDPHNRPTDNAEISVTRTGNTLNLSITADEIKPTDISDSTKIAVYLADEEERAQDVPVVIAAAAGADT